jgi:hypothetical protein
VETQAEVIDGLIAAEMDRRNSRSEAAGNFHVKVNAKKQESYFPESLRRAIEPLVEDGTLAQAALDKLITKAPPKEQPERVAKTEVNKLKNSGNPKVSAALVQARMITDAKRKVEVITKGEDR